jgi:glycopeptide antibiotics resistance protein
VFDVNDLFNNALGAVIGGFIAVGVINGTQRHKDTKDKVNHR